MEDYVAHHARYGPEVRQNLTGALELRAETMTSGALGRVFADPFGMTAKQLLTVPTVLELADFSEEATAFLMNILMFRFQSYLQRLPESSVLRRLIVLEEAHNVFRKTDTEDSALARSNLAFDKMFAEIRASGTGLVLSDQRPSLMPDSVMANTAVKLCLGMDSGEDRGCMGSVMDLSVLQRRALHAFRPGECLMTVRGTPGVFHLQTESRHIRELYGGLPCVRQPVPLQEKCRAGPAGPAGCRADAVPSGPHPCRSLQHLCACGEHRTDAAAVAHHGGSTYKALPAGRNADRSRGAAGREPTDRDRIP